jgi:nicotinamidase-related amidase
MGGNMKPALLVVDIQNAWLDENRDLKASIEKRINTINKAIRWFRKKKLPIIVIHHEDKECGVVAGSNPFRFVETVEVMDKDIRVTKHYPNSFHKTPLPAILKKNGCDTVVIEGLSASGCVLATAFGALDHDLSSYLVKDGVASHSEEHVRFAEEIIGTVNVGSFDKILLRKKK